MTQIILFLTEGYGVLQEKNGFIGGLTANLTGR